MDKKYFFLTGLPRTGSTLLSTILSQNPIIYAGGNSPLCQMMWDMYSSVNVSANQQIVANNKLLQGEKIIKSIPNIYYSDIDKQIIIDKCRSWTIKDNVNIIKKYINVNPKFIILIRPIHEIVNSFCYLNDVNNILVNPEIYLEENSEPIMRSYLGIKNIMENENKENYIIINYNDLIENTKSVIIKIYRLLGLNNFIHNLDNIINIHKEDDSVYGLSGIHDIRPNINKRFYKNYLSEYTLDKCLAIDSFLKL
jgi:sulfotransferase